MRGLNTKTPPASLAANGGARNGTSNHRESEYSSLDIGLRTENCLLRIAYFDEESAIYLAGLLMTLADSDRFCPVTYVQAEQAALAIIAGKIGGTFDAARKQERNALISEVKARFAPRPEGRRRAAA